MIYFSVCSRSDGQPNLLNKLSSYCVDTEALQLKVCYDAKSIYEGHSQNIDFFKTLNLQDDDIIVLCHDDIEILSKQTDLIKYLSHARKPGVGFLGVAGGCFIPSNGAWWNARNTGQARGFVFQGDDAQTMQPNYFGKSGQVVAFDGCFLAATYKTLKIIGLDQPEYLETGWDFYDIHLTYKAYLEGLANYTVPIITMHKSSGQMREGWYLAKDKFLRKHSATLPYAKLVVDKTDGLPR